MDMALWTARSGLSANHDNLAIISNNLANANTTGFKRNRPEFEDLVYQVYRQPGTATSTETNTPNGIVLGTGVRLADNKKIFTEGSLTQTGNPLDVAIHGRGFLQIQVPNQNEMAYTRTGSFQINETGQIVTSNGYVLQPPIVIPQGAQNISISNDGIVSATVAGTTQPEQLGQLQLYDFINPSGLRPTGDNMYLETVSSGTPNAGVPASEGYGSIMQCALETSNVNVVEEMVNLIEAQRTFEINSKAVAACDNMLRDLIQET